MAGEASESFRDTIGEATCSVTLGGVVVCAPGGLAALLGAKGARRLLAALTVTERPQPGRPRAFARARRRAYVLARARGGAEALTVPRAAFAQLQRALGAAPPAPAERARRLPAAACALGAPLYGYQARAAAHIDAQLPPGALNNAFYLQMGTGLGKTRLAVGLIARRRGAAFVVVPSKAIRQQWLDELGAALPGLRHGAYANRRRARGEGDPAPLDAAHDAALFAAFDVLVGVVNTVRAKGGAFFAGVATLVLDEAHELCSPVNMKVLWLAQAPPCVLGLSATPAESPGGLDRVVTKFLGAPVDVSAIPGCAAEVAGAVFAGRVREVEYAAAPAFGEAVLTAAGTTCAVLSVGRIVADPARLRLVAAEVARLFRLHAGGAAAAHGLGAPRAGAPPRRHGVFVFAELREYLPALRAALLERLGAADVYAPELDDTAAEAGAGGAASESFRDTIGAGGAAAVVLRGGASRETLAAAHSARVVLTTYGYSRRGVSIVDMTAIVLATPRRHGMKQIFGRITRRGSDASIVRTIVDIKDVCSVLKGQSTERRKVYKAKGYPIYRVSVDYADVGADFAPPEDERLVWAPLITEAGPLEELQEGAEEPEGVSDVEDAEDDAAQLVALYGGAARPRPTDGRPDASPV